MRSTKRPQPSFLLDRSLLVSGDVDRTPIFETGFQGHQAMRNGSWEDDPLILDDQALAVADSGALKSLVAHELMSMEDAQVIAYRAQQARARPMPFPE